MSILGDVLEVIYARPDPAVSVHAIVREECDRDVARRVGEQFIKDQPQPAVPKIAWLTAIPSIAVAMRESLAERFRPRSSRPEPGRESELTIWLDTSGRARIERTWQAPTGRQRLTTVVATGLTRSGRDESVFDPGWALSHGRPARWPAPSVNDAQRLFGHQLLREIIACLVLDTPHEDELAGRPVVVVEGVARQPYQLWPHWLPFGAESYELAFDREFGSLLAFRGRADGAVYENVAVTEITYGGPVDEGLFVVP